MKKTLIAILLGTVLLSLPVFVNARATIQRAGAATQIAGGNTVVPLFLQLRRRYYRRRYRRAYVTGRRYHPRARYVVRRQRRYIRRRM